LLEIYYLTKLTDHLLFPSKENEFLEEAISQPHQIHIRIQKRGGQKHLTLIEGLDSDQAKLILKKVKKLFATNGTLLQSQVTDQDQTQTVLQLQGDQRQSIQQYLITNGFFTEDQLVIHGY
jgi:translation initiation factor SUI1